MRRTVYDRVHGDVVLPPLVSSMCATRHFQRLDSVRQLGGCSFVYPSATHTRKEHSIGVCHLAGKAGEQLREKYPHLVDEDDVLCLQVAGLVHDLGHGPFSHLFEEFVHEAEGDETWSHEEMAVRMLDLMLEEEEGVWSPSHFATPSKAKQHLAFVKLCVKGIGKRETWPEREVGRGEEKRFLVDVVHNRSFGLDVDKLDYLCRDALAVFGTTHAVNVGRIVSSMRVAGGKLALDAKVSFNVASVYALRAELHTRVYQHKTVVVVEGKVKELMRRVDETTSSSLLSASRDPTLFLRLTDEHVLSAEVGEDLKREMLRPPLLLSLSASLRTRPSCAECGEETNVEDAFCASCGACTSSRAGTGTPLLSPPECSITDADATREVVRRILSKKGSSSSSSSLSSRVRVHVVDVKCGAEVEVTDPHGKVWKEYDPVLSIPLCGSGGSVTKRRGDLVHAPERRRVRTAYCSVGDEGDVKEAERAFREWAETVGTVVEE